MRRRSILAATGALLFFGCSRKEGPDEIVVAAATSLRKAFPAIADAYQKEHPSARMIATYGASGELARQVEAGAGVDVVLFAAKDPLDRLAKSGLVDPASSKVVATNELVLIGRAEDAARGSGKLTFATLGALPAGERLAIGDPGAVPAGVYARDALVRLGVWKSLEGRVVLGGNVAAVLAYVERGEVPAAIVYRTEVEGVKGIVVLDTAKGEWAPVPEVWASVTTHARRSAEARALVDFMASSQGQKIFAIYGFGPPR